MAPDWANAGAFPTDVTAEQGKVGQLLYVLCTSPVLRNAHAIDKDRTLGFHVNMRCMFDLFTGKSGITLDTIPLGGFQIINERLDPERVCSDEIPVENLWLPVVTRGLVDLHQDLHNSL